MGSDLPKVHLIIATSIDGKVDEISFFPKKIPNQ